MFSETWRTRERPLLFPSCLPAMHTAYVPNLMSAFRQQNRTSERHDWISSVGSRFKVWKTKAFQTESKWPSSFHSIPIYRNGKLLREQWFYVRRVIMDFNKLLPAKKTVFSGRWSCVSTAFNGSARLGSTHFFQIVPLQRRRDAFTDCYITPAETVMTSTSMWH